MKLKTLLLTSAAISSTVLSSFGTILINDTFTYSDGPLGGNTPTVGGVWTSHSGTLDDIQVSSGAVILSDAASEDINTTFAGGAITSGTVYYGFDFSVTDPGTYTGTDFEYFAHFKDSMFDFTSRTDLVDFTATGFRTGIAGSSSSADATWGSELAYSTVYRVVVGLDFTSGVSTLWVNPTSTSSTSIASAADTVPTMEAFAFRQSSADPDQNLTIDNLIVATTFSEAAAVPEPTAALLGAIGALALLRRRR